MGEEKGCRESMKLVEMKKKQRTMTCNYPAVKKRQKKRTGEGKGGII